MTQKTPPKKTGFRFIGLVVDLVIDFGLIGLGYGIYHHFMVSAFGPFDFHPIVYSIFGSRDTAVLVIAGLPFVIGLFNLARTVSRLWQLAKPGRPAQPG